MPESPPTDPTAAKLARHLRRLYPRATRRAVKIKSDTAATTAVDFAKYRDDPVGFIRDVLGVILTDPQTAIAQACPGRVKVNAGHGTGKTLLCACICLWWVYTRDPCVIITTAPTERDVIDLLWTEIRLLHARAKVPLPDYFVGPRAPEMFDHDEHWGKGYTARTGDSFQGRHRPNMLFVFDESEGVQSVYWTTTNTMYQPDMGHCWVAIGNPTTTSSQSYIEDMATAADGAPKWKLFTLSCLDHPNITAQLAGLPAPVPNAVSLGQVEQYVRDWSTPLVPGADRKPGDFAWPPGTEIWYRPGPLFKGRVLGIRPTSGVDTVWSDEAWERCLSRPSDPAACWLAGYGITVGCDPASYGDDMTCIHVRCGPLSLHHEAHNGWLPDRVAARIKVLCAEWADWYNGRAANPDRPRLTPAGVKVNIELDGPGVGVLSHAGTDWPNWCAVSVASASDVLDPLGRPCYLNRRSEIWAEGAKVALGGGMDLSYLPDDVRARLKTQLLAPSYHIDAAGRTVVEPKKDLKDRLGRSPDDADALLICHAKTVAWAPSVIGGG